MTEDAKIDEPYISLQQDWNSLNYVNISKRLLLCLIAEKMSLYQTDLQILVVSLSWIITLDSHNLSNNFFRNNCSL